MNCLELASEDFYVKVGMPIATIGLSHGKHTLIDFGREAKPRIGAGEAFVSVQENDSGCKTI